MTIDLSIEVIRVSNDLNEFEGFDQLKHEFVINDKQSKEIALIEIHDYLSMCELDYFDEYPRYQDLISLKKGIYKLNAYDFEVIFIIS